jgi:hypothetical protein
MRLRSLVRKACKGAVGSLAFSIALLLSPAAFAQMPPEGHHYDHYSHRSYHHYGHHRYHHRHYAPHYYR